MPEFDTDPKMMREQQDKDTPEEISRDETARRSDASDSDFESKKQREAALAGEGVDEEQMASILRQNQQPNDKPTPAEAESEEGHGLARSGRSRLED
ncbi:hypothetical protein [Jiella marina]|uniref:hypothetical protein n=1 Tax=Jiella sp. LLJ827 TaxID=2917712 RepID=UPI002101C4AE|nr:hypothetical protein [Jiella sp. LLJ827]MCQ0988128.1 hypothetical protein [Jiella sp. LLJ827]